MARINVEDSIFSDPRFLFICDKIGRYEAMGQFIYLVKLAQRYWLDDMKLIPKKTYELSSFNSVFVDSGMVQERENLFYLAGSERHFAWIVAKKENGKKGGRPSKNSKLIKANVTEAKANESYENPLTLTLSPSLSPALSQKKNICSKFDFNEFYNRYPKRTGKGRGIKKLTSSIKTKSKYDKFSEAFENYMGQINKTGQYIKNWETFCNQWESFHSDDGWEMPSGITSNKQQSWAEQNQQKGIEILQSIRDKAPDEEEKYIY